MPPLQTTSPRPLPSWMIVLGSVLAVLHLSALGLLALTPTSGPWPTRFGAIPADGPLFASSITTHVTAPYYLQPLRLNHSYHFQSNRVATPAISFEVRLKNDLGDVFKTLKFPDENANRWVRHRQELLAQGLGEDQPVQQRGLTEKIAATGKKKATVEYWEGGEDGVMRLKDVPEILVPRDPNVSRPSESAKILSQSYMRHLCREYNARSAELIRISRDEIWPIAVFMPKPSVPETLKSNFGEYRREN